MISFKVESHVEEGGLVQERFGRDLNGELTLLELLAFTKESLIVISDLVLREEQAAGFPKNPITLVDGLKNRAIADVNPLGSIEFLAPAGASDIIQATYQSILDKSPVLTGAYKSHNFVFLNGDQVATDKASLTAWLASGPQFKDDDFIRFVDIEPYARKLERYGVTAQTQGKNNRDRTRSRTTKRKNHGTVVRYNQPNGVYYLTNKEIRAKYRFNSVIRFEFIPGTQLGIVTGYDKKNRQFKTGKKRQVGRAYLYPSILISIKESGVV